MTPIERINCPRKSCPLDPDWVEKFLVDPVKKNRTGSVETGRLSTHADNFSVNALRVDNVAIDLNVGMPQRNWFLVAFVADSHSVIHLFLENASNP